MHMHGSHCATISSCIGVAGSSPICFCHGVPGGKLPPLLTFRNPPRVPRRMRGLCLTAAASRDKPLKALVQDEDSRFLVSIGAIFGVTLATCGLLLVNAFDSRVEAPAPKTVQPADIGIAPIVSSKPVLPDTTLKIAPTINAPTAPAPAPKPTPKAADLSTQKAPSTPATMEGSAPPTAAIAGVAVVATLGGAVAYTQQQEGGGLVLSNTVGDASKAEAQAWIQAWRTRTGVDAAVRKRQAQAWIAAWRAKTQ